MGGWESLPQDQASPETCPATLPGWKGNVWAAIQLSRNLYELLTGSSLFRLLHSGVSAITSLSVSFSFFLTLTMSSILSYCKFKSIKGAASSKSYKPDHVMFHWATNKLCSSQIFSPDQPAGTTESGKVEPHNRRLPKQKLSPSSAKVHSKLLRTILAFKITCISNLNT